MASCGAYSVPQTHCGSNYGNAREGDGDRGFCSSHAPSYNSCASGYHSVSVTTIAFHDATALGAGVQGDAGCTIDACGQPVPPDPTTLPVGDNTDALTVQLGVVSHTTTVLGDGVNDFLTATSGDSNVLVVGNGASDTVGIGDLNDSSLLSNNNILVAGNGASDFVYVGAGAHNQLFAGNGDGDVLFVGTGDNNALIAGDGAGDGLMVGTGNNNDLHAGNGAGDLVLLGTGDNNCLTAGNGDGDSIEVGTGNANELTAGNGIGDSLSVDTGDNNALHAGNGAQDYLAIGTGDHNTLCVGDGNNDYCDAGTGDYNLLETGSGAGDTLILGTGNDNALIAGSGAGDRIIVGSGSDNLLAVGDGTGDLINLGFGNNNTILDGNGANDTILVGGQVGVVGAGVDAGNTVVIGNGEGDQAWGSLGDGNNYLTGKGNDLVHTGGGADFILVHDHTETATPGDPFHLTSQDSLAQNLFADGGNDTFALDEGAVASGCHSGSSGTALGTTVMSGGGGVEKYWLSGLWGGAVITDFNAAHGDRIMIGGAWDGNLSSLGPIHFQYIHSAYDTSHSGNVDLLISFGNASQQSIELLDYKSQDTGNLFNNVTYGNPAAAEVALAHIFDFSHADNQAVAAQVAALNAQHLILG